MDAFELLKGIAKATKIPLDRLYLSEAMKLTLAERIADEINCNYTKYIGSHIESSDVGSMQQPYKT